VTDEKPREKKEPFEYVAYWDHQPKPPGAVTGQVERADGTLIPLKEGVVSVLVCALCGFDANKEGRLVTRVTKFPKGRQRRCETCGGHLKRPVMDPFFSVRDHLAEKAASSSSSSVQDSSQSSPTASV